MARSPFKVLEGFFDADEQQVQIPQLGGVGSRTVGTGAELSRTRHSSPLGHRRLRVPP
jgi:hypothetical protein